MLSDNAHVVKLHLKLSFDKLCLNIDFDRRVADLLYGASYLRPRYCKFQCYQILNSSLT